MAIGYELSKLMPVKKTNEKETKKKYSKKNRSLDTVRTDKKDKNSNKKNKVNKKKATPKNTTEKTSIDRNEIKEAVKKIPALIIKELEQKKTWAQTPEKNQDIKPKIADIYQAPRNRKKWLWTAVVAFTTVILGLWMLNISTFLHNVKIQKDPTDNIMEQGKNDFQTILQTLQDNEKELGLEEIAVEPETEIETDNAEKIKRALEKTLGTMLIQTTTTNTTSTN